MKNVIITGASKGIGYQTAFKFAEQGHKVLAVARSIERLKKLKESVRKFSGELEIKAVDITKEEGRQSIYAHFKKVDILIHNAGYLVNKPFTDISAAELQKVYDVNVTVPFLLSQLLLPKLAVNAHVLIISSVGGVTGTQKFPGLSAYSSSKAAAACLAECLQAEYSDTDISFNALALGAVQTEMLSKAFPGYQALVTSSQMAEYIYGFALNAPATIRGKVQLVSRSNP